jgi:4-amino-4-deoxy-L-arabinose transferase-like glycosyltransferase
MREMAAINDEQGATAPWWKEREVGVVLLLVLMIYFSRLTTLPIRGEETRRAMVAREILWTNDWIVPRQQGEPFLSRPPLGSYPIALLAMVFGDTTPLATRLPTALATLFTTLLIYGYARQFLSRTGALASALFYASMGQVLQLGQIAETEATFTFLVAGSLLLWHWGYAKNWSKYATWSLAYVFVALGALAKGPQAPVYFAGTVGLFLLYQRQWKAIFHPAHFFGIGVFALAVGAWQVPFAVQLGWPAVKDIWASDVGLRFVDETWFSMLKHLATFPAEVWICLLPCSVLLLAYARPSFWKSIAPQQAWLSFVVIAILVTFPTCWFVPGAKTRYYMPLYPCFAPLAGLVVEELLRDGSRVWLLGLWKHYQRLLIIIAVAGSVAVLGFALWPTLPSPALRQSLPFAALFIAVSGVAAWCLWQAHGARDRRAVSQTVIASAAIAGLLYTGLVMNVSLRDSEDVAAQVAELKARLPHDKPLVSFDLLETMFTYHYAEPVVLAPVPATAADTAADLEYFCVNRAYGQTVQLPFAWREVEVISCDRWKRNEAQRAVVIGQRLPTTVAQETNSPRR